MKLNIPKHIRMIIDRLIQEGYEAYIVGGSIRDMLLGKVPNDYDIATDATPDRIKDIFSDFKMVDIGKRFGTIMVIHREGEVEITTFRRDGEYVNGRRPEGVFFSNSIEEDLARRDFTINAIAYNEEYGMIDPYSGRTDLQNRIIRTVGCPKKRFAEDYLRILRAVRFSTQLGFTIDGNTYEACKEYREGILKVSMERIVDEFFKIILSKIPSKGIKLLEDIGILKMLLPEIIPTIGFKQKNPHHTMDVYNHTLCVLDNTPPIIHVRLAALFHDIGKPHTLTLDQDGVGHFYDHEKVGAAISRKILRRFKVSNDLINRVYMLVREHMNHHSKFGEKGIKRLIRRVGKEEIFHLLVLQKADITCSNEKASIAHILDREAKIRSILNEREAFDINQLDITGDDLMRLGFKEGPIIGRILEYLLELVMQNPKLNYNKILTEKALEKFPIE